ncbi:MAG: AzlC family ABC transporter permease [Clostridia bacterium]|nr:AzlC family ABC transporter permease [Clostridia bacterium]
MRTKSFLYGLKMSTPVILGFIPVAIAFAIMASSSGLTAFESVAMSVFVFAGASQMMSVGMIAEGAGYLAIVVATFIMNFRHFIMSTCVFERMQGATPAQKMLLSFGVTDESFAIFTTTEREKCNKWYFFGVFLGTYLSWILGTFIGTFATAIFPASVSGSLGISLYAMFIALLVPKVKTNWRLLIVVVLTAFINFGLQNLFEPSWSLIVSTLVGAGIGMFIVRDEDESEVAE